MASDNQVPKVPFFGSRVVKGIALADYSSMLDERALYVGQWGLKSERGKYEEMVENQGRPRLRSLLNDAVSQGWINAAVVYGYFPCYSEGNDLVILHHEGEKKDSERLRFTFPRQRRDRRLCLSDFFKTVKKILKSFISSLSLHFSHKYRLLCDSTLGNHRSRIASYDDCFGYF